jgi:hypothetical protein
MSEGISRLEVAANRIARAIARLQAKVDQAEMLEQYAAYDYQQALEAKDHGLAAIAKGQQGRAQARLHALREALELFDE